MTEELIKKHRQKILDEIQKRRSKPLSEYDNKDLAKIFEYYSCIRLTEQFNRPFLEYDDIPSDFKENNNMTRLDTGIDASDLDKTIVQCKLRKENLSWKECGTFFGSQNIWCEETNKYKIRWENLIITRNTDSNLTSNLQFRKDKNMFQDITYPRDDILNYCNDIITNPPQYSINKENVKELRYYQQEAVNIIRESKNCIICLPTGTGKSRVICSSIEEGKKYLILVPRVILLEQLKNELIEFNPKFKSKISCIGDGNKIVMKEIIICVYNSVHEITEPFENFEKIFIDEAHHIYTPELYSEDNYDDEFHEKINGSDSEDDENTETYIDIIKRLVRYNNNVYLSATIDEKEGFVYYKKDIRTMINEGFISDYNVHIPIFTRDVSDKAVCSYLFQNYNNMIIYCANQEEGKMVNQLMNEIRTGCCNYVDSSTKKKDRIKILNAFSNNEIKYLVNVRILVEGFNAEITKSVCFYHLPSSETNQVQIIGRALRLHNEKSIAHVVVPFSKSEDETAIKQLVSIIAKNDTRVKQSFDRKIVGGYIDIGNADIVDEDTNIDDSYQEDVEKEITDDFELKYNLVFDYLGNCLNSEEVWISKLEEVKKYIDENGQRPSAKNKLKTIRNLGAWISNSQLNYLKNSYIMKKTVIREKWEIFIDKYKLFFLSYEEKWINNLEEVKQFIDLNKKRPASTDSVANIAFLGCWIIKQEQSYIKQKGIMKNNKIYNCWKLFKDKYGEYFTSNEDKWIEKLEKVKIYLNTNRKKPSVTDKDPEIKTLGYWINSNIQKYSKEIEIMKNQNIKELWELFIDEYYVYLLSGEEKWVYNLNKVKTYIDTKCKRPSSSDENDDIAFLGEWINTSIKNYKSNTQIMKIPEIREKWEIFIIEYKLFFLSNEEKWMNTLQKIKDYINENKKRPSCSDTEKTIQSLGHWITDNQSNYIKNKDIMKNPQIKIIWKSFLDEYKEYFISSKEIWINNLQFVKKYIDNNEKRPSKDSNDIDVKRLGSWISNQKRNYKKNIEIMKNNDIYNKWTEFITDPRYSKYI